VKVRLLLALTLLGMLIPAQSAMGAQTVTATGAARIEVVACSASGLCVAGQGSQIRASLNWGASWADSDVLLDDEEVADAACSNTACFVLSNSVEGGFIGRTLDGASWKWQLLAASVTAVALSCGPSSCTALLSVADQPGPAFLRVSSGLVAGLGLSRDDPETTMNALACSDNVNCIAVGEGREPVGKLHFTTTSGTWLARCNTSASRCRDAYRHVACVAKVCVATAGSGRIYGTTNAGLNWARRASLSAVTLNAISCVSSAICVAVGSGGKIYRSTNSGTTWRSVASPTNRHLRTVSCTSTGRCIAAGDSGTLIRSTSSGSSWSLRPALP
jgi:photosystem II stability/assembly factor-like uncharacterized protein